MSNLQSWAQDKHPSVALMAILYAGLAEKCFRIISKTKDPRTLVVLGEIGQIHLEEWLSYYTKRRLYLQFFFNLIGDDLNTENDITKEENAPIILNKIISGPTANEPFIDSAFQAISRDSHAFDSMESHKDDLLRSLVFMIQVAFPCYFAYLTDPGILLKEARHGNLESMENLFRLDSSTLFDRKIASRLHALRYSKPTEFARLIDCANKPLKRKVTPQKFKVFLASGISYMAELQNAPLTEPEIRALFDAFAKDNGKGEIDPDIPESPHSFYMAIKRDRPYWEKSMVKSHRK